MYKKFLSKTYLRGVTEYDIKIIEDKEYNCYTCVKYIKNVSEPYIEKHTGMNVHLFDKGYYIIEYLPINDNYSVRVFLNDKKEVLEYYIDITKENGYENNSPYYYDLYLDITIDKFNNDYMIIWDEEELLEALDSSDITKKDYDFAYFMLNNLVDQINKNENIYLNRDHKKVINQLLNF